MIYMKCKNFFADKVREAHKTYYKSKQISVWILRIENQRRRQNILPNQNVLIAQETDKIAGFCPLD